MCGIAGIKGQKANEQRISNMVGAMAHRGPDDYGIWIDAAGGLALGHRRLSIIDLSAAGHQPMHDNSGRYRISFNGEIYNYRELRRELESDGISFTTQTDTEVILAAYSRWGEGAWPRLRGMFAIGLWDCQERRLVLVRDRMGIKPLLWAEGPGWLVFASELKALLASGLVQPVVEPQAIFDLLATGSVRQPGTVIRGVRALEPGAILTIEASGRQRLVRYWEPAAADALRSELAKLNYQECVRLVRQKLEEACRYHLIADVPVGSFLSGGVDSTAVTALMARNMSGKVKSFSLGFTDTGEVAHELDAARLAADHIDCDHTEVVLTGRIVADSFDAMIHAIDQPSHDGANTYFVSQAASREVKVALSGLGGDELFAGYHHFALLEAAARRPANVFDLILKQLHHLRPNRLTQVADLRGRSLTQRLAGLRRSVSDEAIESAVVGLLRTSFCPGFIEQGIQPLIDPTLGLLSQTSLVECKQYLLNTLLRDVDAMSMAHSLEVRPVLLDHVLVELALALPEDSKMRHGRLKAVLKDALRDLLPASLLARRKSGFELPLGTWLRTSLRERMLEILEGEVARRFFTREFVRQRIKHLDDPADTKLSWTLLVFLSWARAFGVQPVE